MQTNNFGVFLKFDPFYCRTRNSLNCLRHIDIFLDFTITLLSLILLRHFWNSRYCLINTEKPEKYFEMIKFLSWIFLEFCFKQINYSLWYIFEIHKCTFSVHTIEIGEFFKNDFKLFDIDLISLKFLSILRILKYSSKYYKLLFTYYFYYTQK